MVGQQLILGYMVGAIDESVGVHGVLSKLYGPQTGQHGLLVLLRGFQEVMLSRRCPLVGWGLSGQVIPPKIPPKNKQQPAPKG